MVKKAKRRPILKNTKNFLLIASKHQCSICQAKTIDVHHIIPVAENGTNDLDNLMVVCPNHHREYHEGKYTAEQMRIYKTQWIQKCNIFLEVGVPTEKVNKDREMASRLSLTTKLQFIEQYSSCVMENILIRDDVLFLFFSSGTQTNSELSKQTIILLQMLFRFFKDVRQVTCTRPAISMEQLHLGKDLPELYSFTAKMENVERFIFGKVSIHKFWEGISFFRKKYIDTHSIDTVPLSVPLVI